MDAPSRLGAAPLLFLAVAGLWILANLATHSAIRAAGRVGAEALTPHYGEAYAKALLPDLTERDWYLDRLMRRFYAGWCLAGYDRSVVLFSRMYTLEFSGLAATRVASYPPDISAADATFLQTQAVARRRVAHLGTVTVIGPPSEEKAGTAVVLRAPDEGLFIVPASKVPPSIPIPACQ